MKLTLLSENLQKKLPLVLHAVSQRTQLPILSHLLLETKGDRLLISATDLEIGIEIEILCEVKEEGSITVPAKLFSEVVSSLPQNKATITTTDQELEIIGGKTKAKLQITEREEFPMLYEEKGNKLFSLDLSEVKNLFGKIVFSASTETTRPALSGVLIKPTPEGTIVVATDGYRLSLEKIPNLSKETVSPMIIPAKLLRELFSVGESGEVDFYLSEKNNQAMFVSSQTKLIGRLIDASFPQFEKILPTDKATQATFDKEEMQKAVKTAAIFARDSASVITLSLRKDKVVLSAKTPTLGENTTEVEAVIVGEENEIAFNGKYLQDFLANAPDESLVFEMTGPLNPGVFKGAKDSSYLHLIMPIRTQG